jgi:carbon-monoxide dehydrogenase large subunit
MVLVEARTDDLPAFVAVETVTPTPFNPLGARGISEAGIIGSTPAVVSAVVDAPRPCAVLHLDMPLRPERVSRALRAGGAA